MSEELKKYVNAYMDGEEVEYQYDHPILTDDRWHKVELLSDFENDNVIFRIKPKAENKWQRVIDEGYLCKFWNYDKVNPTIDYLEEVNSSGSFNSTRYDNWLNCEVLREKGIKQPYFRGDDIPDIDGQIVVYFKSEDAAMMYADELAWDWSEVVAYIEV